MDTENEIKAKKDEIRTKNQIQYAFDFTKMVDMYAYLISVKSFFDKKTNLEPHSMFYAPQGKKNTYGKRLGKSYNDREFYENLFISAIIISPSFQSFLASSSSQDYFPEKKGPIIMNIIENINNDKAIDANTIINSLISQVLIEIFPTLNKTELESLFNDYINSGNESMISTYDSISTMPINEVVDSMEIIRRYFKQEWKFKFDTGCETRKFLPTVSDLKQITITIEEEQFTEEKKYRFKYKDQNQYMGALMLIRNLLLAQCIFDDEGIYGTLEYKQNLKQENVISPGCYMSSTNKFDKKKYLDFEELRTPDRRDYLEAYHYFTESYKKSIKIMDLRIRFTDIKDYKDILTIIKFAPHEENNSYAIKRCNTNCVVKQDVQLIGKDIIEYKNDPEVKKDADPKIDPKIKENTHPENASGPEVQKPNGTKVDNSDDDNPVVEDETKNQNVPQTDNDDKESTDSNVKGQKSQGQPESDEQSLITTKNVIVCLFGVLLLFLFIVLSPKKI